MTTPTAASRFTVAHRLSRRLRIVSPLLKNNAERCYILEILLRKRPEIRDVRSVPEIGVPFRAPLMPSVDSAGIDTAGLP